MDIVIRASVIYFILWALIKVIGRRELAELSPFDFVVLFVIGDLVQQGVTQEDMSITGAALAAGTMCFWTIVLAESSYRWSPARRVFKGVPMVILRDGRPVERVLKQQRIDLESLKDAARQHGIADLADVRCGVLEADGMFSFIRNEEGDANDTPTKPPAVDK